MGMGSNIGTLIPMFFRRIRVDPAVATGPFVTTAIDVLRYFHLFFVGKNTAF